MSDFNSDEILHVKKGNIEYLQFKRLLDYKEKINHCFTLRHGGVSEGEVSSLNFRVMSTDKYDNVKENVNRICDVMDINPDDIVLNVQPHGDNIILIDNNNKEDFTLKQSLLKLCDGYITKEKNIALLTTSADCNLIIFYDPVNNVLVNVHSGWRSTVKQIYLKAVKIMNDKFGSRLDDIICCIGPSILSCCWKSNDENLKNTFINIWNNEKDYIKVKDDGYFYVDFHYCIINDLINEGLKRNNIIDSNICTCCNNKDFFSYRQKTMKNEKDFGTMCMIAELI